MTAITSDDVLILNDANTTTSKITIAAFTESFTGQNLIFNGTATFSQAVTFNNLSAPLFAVDATFNAAVNLNSTVTVGANANFPVTELSDVNVTNVANGQVLVWNSATSKWINETNGSWSSLVDDVTPQLGGNLDVNGYEIVSVATGDGPNEPNIVLAPVSTGQVRIKTPNTTGASLGIQSGSNTYVASIKAPNTLAASYSITLPTTSGAANQQLTADGTGLSSWVKCLQQNSNNGIPEYANDSAAQAGGVVIGGIYHTSGAVKVRLT